jgi:hypothetical protein
MGGILPENNTYVDEKKYSNVFVNFYVKSGSLIAPSCEI